MLGTYASALIALAASALIGAAVLGACGRRAASPLAPAVGLAALCALSWWTVRLPGEGTAAAIACGLAAAGSALYLRGRVEPGSPGAGELVAIAVAALAVASLPFIVEGRFGILGTGLNPDMSQHLFAADRLAAGGSERLVAEGYPLGPHSIAVALGALGVGPVAAFNGLTLATAAAACLAPLALLGDLSAPRRWAVALCVGFAYLVAAYLVQGAFKETMQALYLLAFAIALGLVARDWPTRGRGARPLRAVPLAVLAIGSVYTYSFPGLAWLGGAVAVWAAIELGRAAARGGLARALRLARPAAPTVAVAFGVLALAALPEVSRMVEFARFETFDPAGAGLGNLFDRISPLEALGIWPSGDFRVEPGDGFAPAIAFYLGAALGAAALAVGLARWWRSGSRALPAALAAASALWLYALAAGTPYQEAKALVLAAPLVAIVSARGLATRGPTWAAAAFLLAAGGSSALALVNGPVGPGGYSPELAELRERLPASSVVVEAPPALLDDQHGRDYLAWELRGNRICVVDATAPRDPGLAGASLLTVALDADGAVVPAALRVSTDAVGPEPCPLIADSARADPAAGDG